ncbi:MAG: CotH kinase family protein, partial [Ignavibacteriaceae bacterium]
MLKKIMFICFLSLLIITPLLAQDEDELLFSHKQGFYSEPFDLSVTSNIQGAKIRYTLNGANPHSDDSAFETNSPAVITINPLITSNRDKAPAFIITACAVTENVLSSNIVTQTYLFPEKIIELSPDNVVPGPGWLIPWSNQQQVSYGLDPNIYNNASYKDQITAAFTSIPTLSIVTDLRNLFDPDSGIYVNAFYHGSDWERAASLELLNPDGSEGFQINCGIRIRGGWSRHPENPKHAFRVFFKKKYGKGKLDYPLFGSEGADEFDKFDIQTSQNYSWSYYGHSNNTFLRELFSRDLQRDMGQPYTRGRFYHLFINGTYWGLFQIQERSEAAYGETYFGGDKEDYDVVKVDVGVNFDLYDIEATDGTLDKWRELWEASISGFASDEMYFKVQGLNPDGTVNSSYEKLLDVDNLIDYMIGTFFVGDFDGPISAFRGNESPNNFYAVYNRVNPDGFKFFRHDAEHSLGSGDNGYSGNDRTGPYNCGSVFEKSNPQWLHQKLSENPDYRLKFADHVYKHFFNDGALTEQKNIDRITARKNQIETAVIAESARWGDSKIFPSRTKEHWTEAVNYIIEDYLPSRNDVVLQQLINKGLYSNNIPPQFSISGGIIEKGTTIELTSASGQIYYTTDGTDIYLPGGGVSPNAILYTGAIPITKTTKLKTRTLDGDSWSALNESLFIIIEDLSGLRVTELHYHPLDVDTVSHTELEFIELKNTGDQEINMNGISFVDGIDYTFGDTTIIPGAYIVLASNSAEFNRLYNFMPLGEYEGQLDNGGESIVLVNAAGDTIFSFNYDDSSPWPEEADGEGYSIVSKDLNGNGDPNLAEYWIRSGAINGSPGATDIATGIEIVNSSAPNKYSLVQNYTIVNEWLLAGMKTVGELFGAG